MFDKKLGYHQKHGRYFSELNILSNEINKSKQTKKTNHQFFLLTK